MENMTGMEGMTGMDMGTSSTSSMDMAMQATSAIVSSITSMTMSGMGTHMSSNTEMAMSTGMASMANMSGMSGMSGMSSMSSMSSMPSMSSMSMAMAMGGSSSSASSSAMQMTCTMSMLWNWYTKDVCFISSQWKTSTKALFGGTCVGCFALLITICWWRRLLSEYKLHIIEYRKKEIGDVIKSGEELNSIKDSFNEGSLAGNSMLSDMFIPFFETWKHEWFCSLNKNLAVEKGDHIYIYPSIFEHIIYCMGDTMEWCVHHTIMLLFMYFNGYLFISCMIGAGVGFLLFNYAPLPKKPSGDSVSKRCCL